MLSTTQLTDLALVALEQGYWEAVRDGDADGVARLTADDCTLVSATGVSGTDARSIRQMLESGTYTIKGFRMDLDTMRINRWSDDIVSISYGAHEDMEVDGEHVSLDVFDTSVWRQDGNAWLCVLHTEAIAGDAFGRDRTSEQPSS
jgi:ketosteroid isomerase-like protein